MVRHLLIAPKHKANLQINIDITDSLSAYLGTNYYGDYIHYKRRDTTPYEQDAYTLIDLGLRFKATDSLAIRAGITNVSAAQPIEYDPYSDLHLQGRALFVGAEYSF